MIQPLKACCQALTANLTRSQLIKYNIHCANFYIRKKLSVRWLK